MKWWWSSEASRPSDATLASTSPPTAPPAQIPDPADKSETQHETVEQELAHFLPVFAQSQPDATHSSAHQRKAEQSLFSTTVYPTQMSCRESFDAAMHCRGPGGQFLHLYRYGEFRQCTEQWSQFWFCMRTRTKPAAVKQELIREWYKEKEEAQYAVGRPSSEDVWEERTERLERAFDADLRGVGVLPLEDTRRWRRMRENQEGDKAKADGVKAS